jgi:deoxyribodipyrimidine photo-lyase
MVPKPMGPPSQTPTHSKPPWSKPKSMTMTTQELFPPTRAAALERIAAVHPATYARTRNALDGAVSGLSPYLTHGFVSLPEVLAGVAGRHPLDVQHKFVYELGWRAFFRHVWQYRGDGILQSLHEGPLPDDAYATALPLDIRQGQTGVPVIDMAVRTLYATGSLHNHARMWLASYVVHVRKVHWRAGADWLYGHLLDGDLASNHLSWQWVAGTGSSKPYLFNAENVARYAPDAWHSPGSVIDTSYEALDQMARRPDRVAHRQLATGDTSASEPGLHSAPPAALGWRIPDAAMVAWRDVWLVHPWSLGELPTELRPDVLVVGLAVAEFHRAWPWNEKRWQFVSSGLGELAAIRWYGDAAAMGAALKGARSVRAVGEPHMTPWLAQWADCMPAPTLFPVVERRCDSFTQWWKRATRDVASTQALLSANEKAAPGW